MDNFWNLTFSADFVGVASLTLHVFHLLNCEVKLKVNVDIHLNKYMKWTITNLFFLFPKSRKIPL